MNTEETRDAATTRAQRRYLIRRDGFSRWLWAEVRWAWKCLRPGGYGRAAWRMIVPHRPPAAAVERLRKRVLSGDWESPDV